MKFDNKIFLVIFFMFFSSLIVIDGQHPFENFLEKKGEIIKHNFIDKSDTLSSKYILENKGNNLLTVWFGREMREVVCLTGECKIVDIWIFWDGVGNFLGFQLPENCFLTKTNHIFFQPNDYKKLHEILSDSNSVFRGLKETDITSTFEAKDAINQVDSHTGATKKSLQKYVVKDAAYTCYSLWNVVYGETQNEIKRLLLARISPEYILELFNSNEIKNKIGAIRIVQNNPKYEKQFYHRIINLLKEDNLYLTGVAFNYFDDKRIEDPEIQFELGELIGHISPILQNDLLQRFAELNTVDNRLILILIDKFETGKFETSFLSAICKIIHPVNLQNRVILLKLKMLSKSQNQFVINIIQSYFGELK